MKILLLSSMLLLVPAARAQESDREKGMQLYRDGQFPAAAAAFRAALASEGEAPELHYNLALASWRAGQLADAETAVEKYVALAGDARPELHAGLLGALRYDEAKALEHTADGLLAAAGVAPPPAQPGQPPTAPPEDPLAVLEQAQRKAVQAKDHFVRGALAAPSPELLRNTERTLRYLDELQKKIEELKKQREEQKKDQEQKDNDKKDDKESKDDRESKDDKDKQPDDGKKGDDKQDDQQKQKSDEPPKPGEQKDPDGKPSEGNEGDAKPEPKPEPQPGEPKPDDGKPKPDQAKPEPQKSPEAKPEDGQPEPKPEEKPLADQQPRTDAPGEAQPGKELSPEQAQRLLDSLQNLDQKLKDYRARAKSGRRAVERDW